MGPVYRPNDICVNDKLSDECKTPEKAVDIKINKLFISKRRNSLDTSTDDELSRDSIEQVWVRKDSQEKLRDRKGSREISIKFSPRPEFEFEFAKNS